MKPTTIVALFAGILLAGPVANGQSFHRGSFLINITEGSTVANYGTHQRGSSGAEANCRTRMNGEVDPLILEVGFTDRIGVGFTSGGNIFNVAPTKFYGFSGNTNTVKAVTQENTIDINYHFFTTNRVDLSFYGGAGKFKVNIDDFANTYRSRGVLARTGIRARYYFWKNLGAMAMVTAYSGTASPKLMGEQGTIGRGYNTTISGYALEFGLCYKFSMRTKPAKTRGL